MDEVDFWENFRGRGVPKSVANDVRDQLRDVSDHFNLLADGGSNGGGGNNENSDPNSENNGVNDNDNNKKSSGNKTDLNYLDSLFCEGGPIEHALINIFNFNENEGKRPASERAVRIPAPHMSLRTPKGPPGTL